MRVPLYIYILCYRVVTGCPAVIYRTQLGPVGNRGCRRRRLREKKKKIRGRKLVTHSYYILFHRNVAKRLE